MKPTKETIVRVVVTGVAVVNAVATMLGASQDLLQIDETTAGVIYEGVSGVVTVVVSVWATWKNNSFTKPAITADNVKDLLKDGYELTDAIDQIKKAA